MSSVMIRKKMISRKKDLTHDFLVHHMISDTVPMHIVAKSNIVFLGKSMYAIKIQE